MHNKSDLSITASKLISFTRCR